MRKIIMKMKAKKILVLKIGSSILLTRRQKLDEFRISHLASQVVILKESGMGIILVVSGAVSYGANFIDLANNKGIEHRQIAAGVGQVYLTSTFNDIFSGKGLQIVQVLLTKDVLRSKVKKRKLKSILDLYIQLDFIPLINENDVVDLNSFGGNDFLGGKITCLLEAERFIMLSTMEGSEYGIGGAETKKQVIKALRKKGIQTEIVNGKAKNSVLKGFYGK